MNKRERESTRREENKKIQYQKFTLTLVLRDVGGDGVSVCVWMLIHSFIRHSFNYIYL